MPTSADSPPATLSTRSGWRVLTASKRGAAHELNGLPNQDSVAIAETPGGGLVAAVADGHGHSRHIRSARGSRIAVAVACEAGLELAAAIEARTGGAGATRIISAAAPGAAAATVAAGGSPDLPGQFARLARERSVPAIVQRWRAKVMQDVAADPFTDEETGQRRAGDDPTIAYGSTLLLAVTVGHWLLLAQIGDGDVVGVRADGAAMLPVPVDPQLDGMVTTSLCAANAESDFRVVAIEVTEQPLLAVLLATDGYGNAQLADPWAGAFSRDLAHMVQTREDQWLASQLPGWAAMCASADGSADDTTVALLLTPVSEHRPADGGAGIRPPAAGDEESTVPTGFYVQTVPSGQRPPGLETAGSGGSASGTPGPSGSSGTSAMSGHERPAGLDPADQATIERDAPTRAARPGDK